MVLDILYYAKDREPNWELTPALAVVEEVYELIQGKAHEEGVEIKREFDQAAGEFEVDAKAIRSLIVNLLENSLDACRVDKKKGAHQILLGLKGYSEHIELEVGDNANGMEQETREKAFSLFFSSKGTEGTGLGLFISNKIAQAHGGSIQLESEVGRGTCFKVKLPRKRPARPGKSSAVLNPS
jgi:signal transduction histidine kinase